MHKAHFFKILFLAVASIQAGECVAEEIKCPKFIIETPSVSTQDKDWIVGADAGERYLDNVGVFYSDANGGPSLQGSTAPDDSKSTKDNITATWRMNVKGFAQGVMWVGCRYIGTTAILFKKIDPSTKVCVATYDLLDSGHDLQIRRMDCQK